ncbi:MAG: branched-chain amino acid ABC transporter permease [Candidatus Nanoarchaeia archaeon]
MSFMPYVVHLLVLVCIYVILSTSLDFALGHTGLMNLGHIAFFGIGAYTSVLLNMSGVPYPAALLAAGLFASVFGYFLVYATKNLKGDYLALATLGFNFVIYSILLNWTSLTRGPLGIPGIPKPNILGYVIKSNMQYLIFAAIICVVCVYILKRIAESPFGRLLHAARDDEVGLRVLGKDTSKLKYKAMMISAFFAGIAGSLFAHYITYIDPSSFTLTEIILVFTIVIVGGIASFKGNIVSTFIILLIPEALRFVNMPSSILGPMRQIVYAMILLLILLYKPRGLFGRIDLE